MGQGDTDVFGPVVVATEVETAVRETLEQWMATYLRFMERHLHKEAGWLPMPKSYTVTSDWDHFPEEQLPAVLIMSQSIAKPEMDGRKEYRAHFPINIGVFVSAQDRKSTEQLAKYYGAALRTLLLQKGGLGGVAAGTAWEGEDFDVRVLDSSQRTIGTAEIKLMVEVRQLVRRLGGPKEPLPAPQSEPGPWPLVTKETLVVLDPEALSENVTTE